jgi:hypothetical protein
LVRQSQRFVAGSLLKRSLLPTDALTHQTRRTTMLFTIAAILFVLWLLGVFVFKVSVGLIHLLLVLALVVGLIQLFRGRRV